MLKLRRLYFVLMITCVPTNQYVDAKGQHMICKPVEDVFTLNEGCNTPERSIQGRPGKLGPKSVKGDPGPMGKKGRTAVFDTSEIASFVDARIQLAIKNLEEQFDLKLNKTIERISAQYKRCEILLKNKCFWSMVVDSRKMKYEQAFALCIGEGGHLADITNAAEYETLTSYLRAKTSVDGMQLWIGTSRNQVSGTVANYDGSPSLYQKWYPGYPGSDDSHKQVMIQISQNKANANQGMFNYRSDYDAHGYICQL